MVSLITKNRETGKSLKKNVPDSLISAYRDKNIIPLVGAGVSMSILDIDGKQIFPSWKELLKLAAIELSREKKNRLANGIDALLELDDYTKAADYARKGLTGGLWSKFFKKNFDIDINKIDIESLALSRSIWSLSNRVITLNYDKMMAYACPDKNLVTIDNSAKPELADFCNKNIEKPYLWHIHGRIDNIIKLIFTSEGYNKLYIDTDNDYLAAISVLKRIIGESKLLFIGCSLDDVELINKLDEQYSIFEGNTGPHYALVHKNNEVQIKQNIRNSSIELIAYEEHGKPLIDLVDYIACNNPTSRMVECIKNIETNKSNILDNNDYENNLNKLKEFCIEFNKLEIDRVAKRKYIKELYVIRDIEATLKTLLISDEVLSNKLAEITDIPYEIVGKAKKKLDSLCKATQKIEVECKNDSNSKTILGKEDIKKQNIYLTEKIDIAAKIDQLLKEILANSAPCDGINRSLFSECESLFKKLLETADIDEHEQVSKALEVIHPANKFITVIVDRAGGGKTNLLCHLSNICSLVEPSLFFGGRVEITSDDSIALALASALGNNETSDPYGYISRVNQHLERLKCHATIFIDGINENRNIEKLNGALDQVCSALESSRFRFVFSCRDIYWSFFKNSKWVQSSRIVEGNLYSFSTREQELAIDAYLNYFNIEVNLGVQAKERCKHPLLLRFFCEAYSSPCLERINLGNVMDIRLKPLFDDYWKAKIGCKSSSSDNISEQKTERVIFKLVSHLLESNETSLTTDLIPSVTGIDDLKSKDSTYLGLLDEDIIIEEDPTTDVSIRKVVFVYEEFMEYAAAKFLYNNQRKISLCGMDEYFFMLDKKVSSLVNILGIAEYFCAFYLDNKNYKVAFRLVVNMAKSGDSWRPIVSNIFKKYDAASSMIVQISLDDITNLVDVFTSIDQDIDLNCVQTVLSAIGDGNRSLMTEICVLILYSIILPRAFSFEEIVDRKVPKEFVIDNYWSSDEYMNKAAKLISLIAKLLAKNELSTIKCNFWKSWSGRNNFIGVGGQCTLVKALPSLLIGTQRRNIILTLACNGLFHEDVSVRRACALVTRNLKNDFAKSIRNKRLGKETNVDVIGLLHDII